MTVIDPVNDLEQRGFVRVACEVCADPQVWLRCDGCQKSDHFLLEQGQAACSCGARYAHARCLCGQEVPGEGLRFVPFKQGPMALADLEWSRPRLAVLGLIVAGLLAGGAWLLLG